MMSSHHARTRSRILTAVVILTGGWGIGMAPHDALAGQPPVARITTNPSEGVAPLTVGLDARNSRDPDGAIMTYDWDFGDTTEHGSSATVTHTYHAPGVFSVLLTTTDNDGQTARITTTVRVSAASLDAPLSVEPTQIVPISTESLVESPMAPPTITPSGGTFTEPVTVTLATGTMGAVAYYTTDGGPPAAGAAGSSRLYTEPFTLTSGLTTVKALASLNQATSSIAEAVFSIAAPRAAAPTIEPSGGAFSSSVGVILRTATPNADIRYTLDGTEPTQAAALYTDMITLTYSVLVQARAFRDGFEPSEIAVAAFTVTPQKVEMPSVTPTGGAFAGETKVTLTSTTPGSQIRYTLDGTEPTDTSLLYRPVLTLTSSAIVRARVFFAGFEPSDVASAAFTIGVAKAATPLIETPGGFNTASLKVTLRTSEQDAAIRYTLDGTEPTEASRLYGKPLGLTDDVTVKARVFRAGVLPSDVATAVFKKANEPQHPQAQNTQRPTPTPNPSAHP